MLLNGNIIKELNVKIECGGQIYHNGHCTRCGQVSLMSTICTRLLTSGLFQNLNFLIHEVYVFEDDSIFNPK